METHFQKLRDWIELEAEAERQRMAERRKMRSSAQAEKRGETLLDLVVIDEHPGLGGRILATLVKRNRTLNLPWNRFKAGSPIVATSQEDESSQPIFGVVCSKNINSIQVAFDSLPDGQHFRLDLSADEVSRSRQLTALNVVQNSRGRTAQLRDILMRERSPQFDAEKDLELDETLNESQKGAVRFAMSAQDLAIIHGPPGTGKTTTIVELIRQAVLRGEKVFATAPSNTAVDNMLERLAALPLRVVRIGHPARVHETLQSHTLDWLADKDSTMAVVHELRKEAEQISRKAEKFTRGRPAPGSRQDLRRESRQMREDARQLEKQIVESILDRADVICATTTYDPDIIGDRRFQLAVIDEACQSTEPGCWPVIPRTDKIVLAGDHCQLPPTVLSQVAAKEGFERSLMQRMVEHYGDLTTRLLTVQYRMNLDIMEFSSDHFYDGKLVAHPSVAEHRLCDIEGIEANEISESVAIFIDTAGAGWDEELEPDGESKRNPSEGRLVLELANQLCQSGLPASDIAIIAPYSAQVRWLRQNAKRNDLEIDTVDGFQGREKEAVIISLVRSNAIGEIGFLSDKRRMNVALTRARRKLIVIGDSATLGSHEFFNHLIEYFESIDGYASVWSRQQSDL